jgi:hypothetical protein
MGRRSITTTGQIPVIGWILTFLLLGDGFQNKGILLSFGFVVRPPIIIPFDRVSIDTNERSAFREELARSLQTTEPHDHRRCEGLSSNKLPQLSIALNARMGNTEDENGNTNEEDNDDNKENIGKNRFSTDLPVDDEAEYQRKVAEAKAAIEEAKRARDKYYRNKNSIAQASANARKQIYKTSKQGDFTPLLSVDNDDNDNNRDNANGIISIRSRIEYTDAGTLIIKVPPRGTSTISVFAGAFSAAWFSAVVPATISTGGAGLLFMIPFWAAGGMVAKQAVVDPYLSFRLSVGQYAWSLRRTYAGKAATVKSVEGATDTLRGAVVEVGVVVNEVPQYELRLYTSSSSSSSSASSSSGDDPANGDVTTLGLGLALEELDYLAKEINSHLEKVKNFPENVQLLEGGYYNREK